jgi:hypothetical protein
MNPSMFLVSAALLGTALIGAHAASPDTFELFSASEAATWNTPGAAAPKENFRQRELREPGVPSCHAIPPDTGSSHNPGIEIVAPTLDKPLTAPLDIDVKFRPAGNAPIRPDTFRVCYVGFLVMDITRRVTDHVTVSEDGLHVTGAQLPRGHHHLVMLVADKEGAIGGRDAVFDIQ